jgi:hypothetical protein
VVVPTAPLPICKKRVHFSLTSIKGVPIARQKQKQEQYRTALRVQCITLFDAKIPLDAITS